MSSFLGSLYQIVLTVNKFAPTTLNQYTALQSETTVTTTITQDGVPIIFPLVIGPGGVAWGTEFHLPINKQNVLLMFLSSRWCTSPGYHPTRWRSWR